MGIVYKGVKGDIEIMNMNNYTIKSQEAVQEAVQVAQQKGQQAIETGHLLKGVIAKGENITTFIFNKLGMNGRNVTAALERIVDGYPRVSGGQPYLSENANKALERATKLAGEMGDQYVSLVANAERRRDDGKGNERGDCRVEEREQGEFAVCGGQL